MPFYLLYGYEPPLPHEMYILPSHVDEATADRTRNTIAQKLNHARNLARSSIEAVHKAMKANVDANRKLPDFKQGDLVMAVKPQTDRFGKLARIYDGPYRIQSILPGSRTLHLLHTKTGEVRVSHIDNIKHHGTRSSYRLPDKEETTIPVPSPAQERRAIEMLQRAAAQAKHVVGAPRARAVIAEILGYLQVPPLPQLPARKSSIPPSPIPVNNTPSQRPDIPSDQPLTEPIPWVSNTPWHLPKPKPHPVISQTSSGRHIRRPPEDLDKYVMWIDFNTDHSTLPS